MRAITEAPVLMEFSWATEWKHWKLEEDEEEGFPVSPQINFYDLILMISMEFKRPKHPFFGGKERQQATKLNQKSMLSLAFGI